MSIENSMYQQDVSVPKQLFELVPSETIYRLTHNDLINLFAEKTGQTPENVSVRIPASGIAGECVFEAIVKHKTFGKGG